MYIYICRYIYIYMLESAGGCRLLSITTLQFPDNTLVGAVQQPTACQSRKQHKGRKACRAGKAARKRSTRNSRCKSPNSASIPSAGEVSTLSRSSKPRRQRRCRKATLRPKRAKTRRKSSTCKTKATLPARHSTTSDRAAQAWRVWPQTRKGSKVPAERKSQQSRCTQQTRQSTR